MREISYTDAFRLLDQVASGEHVLTRPEAAQVRGRLSSLQVDLEEKSRRLDGLDIALGRK